MKDELAGEEFADAGHGQLTEQRALVNDLAAASTLQARGLRQVSGILTTEANREPLLLDVTLHEAMLPSASSDRRRDDPCLTDKIIAQRTSLVKYQAMPKPGTHLTEPYVRWVEAEMVRRGWKPAELARRAKMNQGVISRMLSREVATDIQTLERLAKALGKNLPILQPASEQVLPEGQGSTATAPRLPQAEGSGRQERAGQAGGETYPGASGAKRASSAVALEPAPALDTTATRLRPDQEGTAAMAANALRKALQLVQTNLHGPRDREIMAEELEHFADQLRERLGFADAAADLYKAALNLRKGKQSRTS